MTTRPLPKTDHPVHVARLYVQLALAALELNRVSDAREQFFQLVAAEKDEASLEAMYLRIAGTLGRVTNRQAALTLMQDLVKKNANLPAGHYALAHLAVRANAVRREDGTRGQRADAHRHVHRGAGQEERE